MPREIERKFLVKDQSWKENNRGIHYHQGYLNSRQERVVRVRTIGEQAFLTIKGKNIGAVRTEYEYEIPVDHAEEMLDRLCEKPTIKKYRYKIEHKGFTWEVDEFLGENEGLIVAEIELEEENQVFDKPAWVGEEVTGQPRYFNSNLIKNPYKNWK